MGGLSSPTAGSSNIHDPESLELSHIDLSEISEEEPISCPSERLNPDFAFAFHSPVPYLSRHENNLSNMFHSDLDRLQPGRWYNDRLVDFGLSIWMQRHLLSAERGLKLRIFSTFFYTKLKASNYKGVSAWTRHFDVFDLKFVVVPVFLESHWLVTIVMDPAQILPDTTDDPCYILCLDSLGISRIEVRRKILDWLRNEAATSKGCSTFRDAVSLDIPVPIQSNANDCGPHMLHNVDRFFRNYKRISAKLKLPMIGPVTPNQEIWRPDLAEVRRASLEAYARQMISLTPSI